MTAATSTLAFGPAKIGGDEAVRLRHESQTPRHGQTMTEGQSQMLETSSKQLENRSKRMRQHLKKIGGPVRNGENRKRWLERVAYDSGLTYRKAKSVWYGEPVRIDRDDLDRAETAIHQAKQIEINELRARLAALEQEIEDEVHGVVARPASAPSAPAHDGG